MDYHTKRRSEDGVIQMPKDGSTFRDIEEGWVNFKEEPCNFRISMVSNGINLFGEL